MYKDVAKSFGKSWHSTLPRPRIARIYLITWTKKLRSSFDIYRANVGKKMKGSKRPKEVKRFRSETRYCRLGDPGRPRKPCKMPQCRLCRAIVTGFRSSLNYKRQLVAQGQTASSRFGAGIYMAPSSSKAYGYALNGGAGSGRYRAVFSTRVVLGKSQIVKFDDWRRTRPQKGYDSIEAHPQAGGPTELLVFNANAVRPAYMIILKV